MSTTPGTRPPQESDNAQLNPSLKRVHDSSYGADQKGRDPMESISLKKNEGAAWPAIWATITILCVLIAIFLILG